MEPWKSLGKGDRKIVRTRGVGGHQETRPSESTNQDAYELTETESASTGPTCVCSRSSVDIL